MTLMIADVIAGSLRREGVEVVFGLPGGENVPLVAAMDRAGIRFVMMRHESRAVWAADAYARIGRRVGVCLSTLGPGAANLAAGLAHAYLDRSPVLAITAQLPDHLLQQHSHQRLDLQQVFSPVSKTSYVVKDSGDLAGLVHRAIRTATRGKCGPVHLQLSSPVSTQLTQSSPGNFVSSRELSVSRQDISIAIDLLKTAQRPAIVVGLGIEPDAPYSLLRSLAESLQAAVIVTPKAKGAIAESHPLYAGVLGLERRESSADTLHKADLILGLGFDPVELMVPWSFNTQYIYAGSAPNEDPEIPAVVNLVGDLNYTMESLVSAINASPELNKTRWFTPYVQPGSAEGFGPSQVIRIARELLPKHAVVTVDVGAHKLLIGKLWSAWHPNQFLISNGLSTMGYALPAAIGAKLARPEVPVICFTGDGGLGMVDSALETAVRMDLPIVVVVLADEAMSLIRLKQLSAGYKTIGTLMGPTNWMQVAQGFGATGMRVEDASAFSLAFGNALKSGKPVLIEARIDPKEYQTF